MAERDIESLGVMGWGLMLAENSSAVAAVVAAAVLRAGPREGPLDFREIVFVSDIFPTSMILLVYVGQNQKNKILKLRWGGPDAADRSVSSWRYDRCSRKFI